MPATRDRPLAANRLTVADFIEEYLKPAVAKLQLPSDVCLSFATSTNISAADFDACFNLVHLTSAAAYNASTRGWSSREKRAEMREPDMKFLMVYSVAQDDTPSGLLYEQMNFGDSKLRSLRGQPSQVVGFLSFELGHEDGMEVIYCYEIHLQSGYQGRGLGAQLMSLMSLIGAAVGVQKAMLTVFTSNESAIEFYKWIGYEWYDEEVVPSGRQLRSGMTEKPKPSYVIMAKDLI